MCLTPEVRNLGGGPPVILFILNFIDNRKIKEFPMELSIGKTDENRLIWPRQELAEWRLDRIT